MVCFFNDSYILYTNGISIKKKNLNLLKRKAAQIFVGYLYIYILYTLRAAEIYLRYHSKIVNLNLLKRWWEFSHFLVFFYLDKMQKEAMQKEASKKIWLFSYGADGPIITNEIWRTSTEIQLDEFYLLVQRDFKYVLIRANKRVTPHRIKLAIAKLEAETGIKSAGIFGYDEISSGCNVSEHPGMKLIIEHMNKGSQCFEYWLAMGGSIRSNKRCLLNRYLNTLDLKEMSKIQLLNFIQNEKAKNDSLFLEQNSRILELEQETEEMEQELHRRMSRIKQLKSENKMLQDKNKELESLFTSLGL